MSSNEKNTNLLGRSLLTLSDFTNAEIRLVLNCAQLAKKERQERIMHQRFVGLSLAMLYEKRSTRTRSAFETAFGEEGGHPVFLTPEDIHLGGKESLKDTARVLGRMYDAIQFRGFKQKTVEELAFYSGIPVYNGLTDSRHPSQILADLMTIEENFNALKGLTIAYVGDCRNNIANSLMIGCSIMGLNSIFIGPSALAPNNLLMEKCRNLSASSNSTIQFDTEMKSLNGADIVYTDVWVSMGEEKDEKTRFQLLRPYQINLKSLHLTGKSKTLFMHDLPAVKGLEVTEEVFESQHSVVWQQAENRKHIARALMLLTLPSKAENSFS